MNRTIDNNSSGTGNSRRTRLVQGLAGAALAAGLILGGFSLASTGGVSGRAGAAATPATLALPQFTNAADAEDAGRGLATGVPSGVQPMFGTAADAENAARGLVDVPELARPQPVQPMFATAEDAEHAAKALIQEAMSR